MNSPPANVSASAALARAGDAGPYFVLRPWSAQEPWRPFAALLADPAALAERAGRTRIALARNAGAAPADVEERVAASIMFLGLAAQLVSPLLGAAVLGGVVPRLTAWELWWQPAPADGGPWRLAALPVAGTAVGDLAAEPQAGAAALLLSARVQALTGPVTAAFGAVFRLSPQVLRGNVASAVAGAGTVLAVAVPQRAGIVGDLTARILAMSPLRGAGTLIQPDPARPQRLLLRRSCCLYYRIPGAGICGDCVLQAKRGAGGPRR